MPNMRDIKNRIESVKNTRQITNAMKMVAAAKLQKSQNAIIKARPYADQVSKMLMTIKHKKNMSENMIFSKEETKKRALVVVTADRGLCGSFNSSIIKTAVLYLEEHPNTELICVGKKGYDFFKKIENVTINKEYIGLFNEMDFNVSAEIAQFVKNEYTSMKYDQIDVVYNHFRSIIQQIITVKSIFPIPDLEKEEDEVSQLDYLYEPSMEEVVEELSDKYINVEFWRILLESSASEQGARMTAMDSATDNATELIESLTLNYNMVRQAAITTEIVEISSGAEALN